MFVPYTPKVYVGLDDDCNGYIGETPADQGTFFDQEDEGMVLQMDHE